jgi:hypothetical protein
VKERTNGKHNDLLHQQGLELDRLLEEALRVQEGARAQAKRLANGHTDTRSEHKVGDARREGK